MILDWFHIGMRLRPIEHMATKVAVALEASQIKKLLAKSPYVFASCLAYARVANIWQPLSGEGGHVR
jgi:hypothetical protein